MTTSESVVFIVDDDQLIRDSLTELVSSVGMKAVSFSSAREFLESDLNDRSGCLVLDIRMPDISGLDLQDELHKRDISLPVIFITGHGTVPLSVRAMKAGAVDFLQKPFEDQDLLDAINRAMEQDSKTRSALSEHKRILKRFRSLTPRERQVLILVADGCLNKQIGTELGLSENTVKTHRQRIMRKMKAKSMAELMRLFERIYADIHDC